MKRKFKIISKILTFLMVINLALGTTRGYAASYTYTPLKDMDWGDIIKFGGREWVIISPSAGYIILSPKYANYNGSAIGKEEKRKWGSGSYKNSAIRSYLNGDFLKKLGADNEGLIQTVTWSCGNINDVNSETVEDKVGLFNIFEFEDLFYTGFFDHESERYCWWLNTWYTSGEAVMAGVWDGNFLVDTTSMSWEWGVRPVLYLKPGLYVSKDGQVFDPKSDFVTTKDIEDGTIKLEDLSDEVKNKMEYITTITVVTGQAFNVAIGGYDSITHNASNSGVTVDNSNTSDGYIRLSGILSIEGVQKITIEGQDFIFNVINPPSPGTVNAVFN